MAEITGARESVLYKTADALLNARRTGVAIADLPADLQPADENEAFFVQDVMAQGLWRDWRLEDWRARRRRRAVLCAHARCVDRPENGSTFEGPMYRLNGVECEIAFRDGHATCRREARPTRRDEVRCRDRLLPPGDRGDRVRVRGHDQSVAARRRSPTCRFTAVLLPVRPSRTGRVSTGPQEKVTLIIDGSVRMEKVGSNPGGTDLLRLMVYLANQGAGRTHGLRAGQYVTTGSWTGVTWSTTDSSSTAQFEHAGSASLAFAKGHLPG